MRLLISLLLWLAPSAFASPAEDLLRQGRLDEAVPAVIAEARQRPDDLEAQERWIDLMLNLGLPGRVQDHVAAQARARPDQADAHYLVGRAATDVETSVAAYETALRFDPDHARSYMGLGAVHKASGTLADAAAMYQRALRLDSTLAEAWGGLLTTFVATGDREGALAVARAAISEVPEQAEAWLVLATYQPAEAGEILATAVTQVPWDARLHAARAEHLLGAGDPAGALAAAERALRTDPLSPGALLAHMFATELTAGRLDRAGYRAMLDTRPLDRTDPAAAKAAYDRLAAAHPRSALVRMARARVLQPTDAAAALAELEAAVALDGDNDEAVAALGLALRGAGAHARAALMLERASRARPRDVSLALALARSRFDAGDTAGGIAVVQAAEQRHPYHLELALQRIGMLSASGDAQGAYQAAVAASERIPDVRLGLARAAAAKDAGRLRDAADLYDTLAQQTGRREFAEIATKLRAQAAEEAEPATAPR